MKKVLKFIMALGLVLPIVACEPQNPENGNNNQNGQNPGEGQTGTPIEVIGLKAPEYAPIGGVLTVDGVGFPEGAKIVLKTADAKEIELVTKAVDNGLSADVPADLAQNVYQIIIKADKYAPLLVAEKFNLYIKKSIASIDYSVDMGGIIQVRLVWSVDYAADKLASVTKTVYSPVDADGDQIPDVGADGKQVFDMMPIVYGLSEANSVYTFANELGMPGFSLTVDGGKVVSNTVEREPGVSDKYDWLYNEKGYISELKATKTYYKYTFDANNNLVETQNSAFTYPAKDAKGEFNPYHLDAAMCMLVDAMETYEDFQIAALLLGLTGKPSANIPESATADGLPVASVLDKDGYVVSLTAGGADLGMSIQWNIAYK